MAIGGMTARASVVIETAAALANLRELEGAAGNTGRSLDSAFSGAGGGLDLLLGRLATAGKIMMGMGGIITAGIATPLMLGSKAAWNQVDSVEQATLALRAYEKDASKVDTVLAGLLEYARGDMGVLFQREELFAAAQGLKVMGAETDNLVEYVEIMSRSVGLGTANWDDLNRVIGRVGATGRLTGTDFDMLTKMGYQLDESLRNTNVTWEELFEHLDNGIPAEALAGQADTIRGKSIRLQSALRGLGNAFLGVDSETSKFIEGGLGDMMVKGMVSLTNLLKGAAPAAQTFGNAIASIVRPISTVFEWISKLPPAVTSALVVLTGMAGAWLTVGGAVLAFLPTLKGIIGGLRTLLSLTTGIKVLGAAFGAFAVAAPILIAIGVAIAAIVAYSNDFAGFRDAVQAAARAFSEWGIVKQVTEWVGNLVGAFRDFRDAFDGFGGKKQTLEVTVAGDDKYVEWQEQEDGSTKYAIMSVQDDGSIAEYGEIIESYTDENDPNIAHIKVQGDDGEYWTTIDKTTGEIGEGTITVEAETAGAEKGIASLRKGLQALEKSLRARNMPFLANLVSGLDNAIFAVQDFSRRWQSAFETFTGAGRNPVAAGLQAVQVALYDLSVLFPSVGSTMRTVGSAFGALATVAQEVGDRFTAFREEGLNPLEAAFETALSFIPAFEDGIRNIVSGFDSLLDAVGNVVEALGEFARGNWSEGFDLLGEAIVNTFEGLGDLIEGALDILGEVGGWILERLGDLGSLLWNWFSDAVTGVDWGAVMQTALDVLSSAGSWVYDKLGDAATEITTWWTENVDIDWGGILTTSLNVLAGVGMWVYNALGDAWGALETWWTETVLQVDWAGIAQGALDALGDFGNWVITAISDIAGDLQDWFGRQFEGVDFVKVARGATSKLAEALGNAVGTMAGIYEKVYGWLAEQIESVDWGNIGENIGRLLAQAVKGAIGLLVLGWDFYIKFIKELADVDWAGLATEMWNLFKAAALGALDLIGGIITGFYDEFKTGIGDLSWGDVWNIITDSLKTAFETVVSEVIGIVNTIIEAINNIPWVPDIPLIENPYEEVEAGALEAERATKGLQNAMDAVLAGRPTRTSREGSSPEAADARGQDWNAGPPLTIEQSLARGTGMQLGGMFFDIAQGALEASQGVDQMNFSLARSQPEFMKVASTAPVAGGAVQTAEGQVSGAAAGIGGSLASMQARAASSFGALAATALSQSSAAQRNATTQFSTMQSNVSSRMSGMQAGIATRMAALALTVNNQSSTAQRNASSNFTTMQSNVQSSTSAMQSHAAGRFVAMATSAALQGAAISRNLTTKMNEAQDNARSALQGVVSAVIGRGAAAAAAAYSAGANISLGFANGMNAYLGSVIAAANRMVAEADRAVRAKARITSPSRLFMELGEYMGAGMEEGILGKIRDVSRATDQLVHLPTVPKPDLSRLGGLGDMPLTAAGAAGGGITVNLITIPPDAWERLNSDVARSARFVDDWSAPDSITQFLGGD